MRVIIGIIERAHCKHRLKCPKSSAQHMQVVESQRGHAQKTCPANKFVARKNTSKEVRRIKNTATALRLKYSKKDKVAHDFVLVSSKSAGLRWSLGQPLKWRTGRLFPRRIVGRRQMQLPSRISSSSSSPLRLLTKQNWAKMLSSYLHRFLSPPSEIPIHLGQTRFLRLPHIY